MLKIMEVEALPEDAVTLGNDWGWFDQELAWAVQGWWAGAVACVKHVLRDGRVVTTYYGLSS